MVVRSDAHKLFIFFLHANMTDLSPVINGLSLQLLQGQCTCYADFCEQY